MKQPCRVLFVPGSGSRNLITPSSWRVSDVGVALRRGLPGDLIDKLVVESSTHGRLLEAAPTIATLAAPKGPNLSDPGKASYCQCCEQGDTYRWYGDLLRGAPDTWGT
jgi:hypothetical protein